jgi:hypothetical protein
VCQPGRHLERRAATCTMSSARTFSSTRWGWSRGETQPPGDSAPARRRVRMDGRGGNLAGDKTAANVSTRVRPNESRGPRTSR